jgi:hypothetical protein
MSGRALGPYFCRVCGRQLPVGSRRFFHADCLKADKRHRTRETRRLEGERFEEWLKRQRCALCGAKFGASRVTGQSGQQRILRPGCEASRGGPEPPNQGRPGKKA